MRGEIERTNANGNAPKPVASAVIRPYRKTSSTGEMSPTITTPDC